MKNTLHIRRAEHGDRGISQLELARLAGIHRQRYWLIERGHATPTDDEMHAIAYALGLSREKVFPELVQTAEVSR